MSPGVRTALISHAGSHPFYWCALLVRSWSWRQSPTPQRCWWNTDTDRPCCLLPQTAPNNPNGNKNFHPSQAPPLTCTQKLSCCFWRVWWGNRAISDSGQGSGAWCHHPLDHVTSSVESCCAGFWRRKQILRHSQTFPRFCCMEDKQKLPQEIIFLFCYKANRVFFNNQILWCLHHLSWRDQIQKEGCTKKLLLLSAGSSVLPTVWAMEQPTLHDPAQRHYRNQPFAQRCF